MTTEPRSGAAKHGGGLNGYALTSCSGGAWYTGRIAGEMTHGVNNDFGFSGLVKNDIRIGRCRQTANGGIIGANADVGMKQEKVDNSLNASLDALGSLR
jgi:hypothetical protein